MTTTELIHTIELTISSPSVSWVLFSHGTFIIFESTVSAAELEQNALEIIAKYGPVNAGGSAGDFSVSPLRNVKGWAVSSHKQGLFTYVHPDEIREDPASDIEIGLRGRFKRNLDSGSMEIIHVHVPAAFEN